MTTLAQRYQQQADVTGHSPTCRRRIVPTITSDSRAIDPENCERCVRLTALLDAVRERRAA